MSVTAILRGAAAALLVLIAVPAASAAHRGGHGDLIYGKSKVRMHAGHHHRGMRPALSGHHHGMHHGHRGFHARHHARPAFFPQGRHGYHHGRFHGAYGHSPRRRFFPVHGHRHAYGPGYGALSYGAPAYTPYGHGAGRYGFSYASYPLLAYGTVAGAAPYGPLYNRPAGLCY